MVSELLVAVGVVAQDALLVITTVTTSPLAIVDVVNVELLVPAFTPFIFH
jgi:hypothetical protein